MTYNVVLQHNTSKWLCANRSTKIKKKNDRHVPDEYVECMISLFAGMKKNNLFGNYSYKAISELINPLFDFKYASSTVCKKMKQFDKYSNHYAEIQDFITMLKKKAKSAPMK